MAAEPFILPLQKKKGETKSAEEKAGKKNESAKKKVDKGSRKVTFNKVSTSPHPPHVLSATRFNKTLRYLSAP